MKTMTVGLTSTILIAGAVGAVAVYQNQAASDAELPQPVASSVQPSTSAKPAPREVRWAPCPRDTKLRDGACVTHVVRTVVVPETAAPLPSSSTSTSSGRSRGDDGRRHDRFDDHGDDAAEDDGFDDDGFDDDGYGDDSYDDSYDDHGQDSQDDHGDDDHGDDD